MAARSPPHFLPINPPEDNEREVTDNREVTHSQRLKDNKDAKNNHDATDSLEVTKDNQTVPDSLKVKDDQDNRVSPSTLSSVSYESMELSSSQERYYEKLYGKPSSSTDSADGYFPYSHGQTKAAAPQPYFPKMVEVVQGVTAEQAAGAHREEMGHSQRQGKDIDVKDTEEGPEMFRPNYEDACELGPDDMYPNQDCVEVGPDLPQLDKGYCEKHETYKRAEYCGSGQGNLAPFTSWCSSCVPHDEHEGKIGAESHKTPESPDVKQKLQERVPEVGMEPPHRPKTVQIGSWRVKAFSVNEMSVFQTRKILPYRKRVF